MNLRVAIATSTFAVEDDGPARRLREAGVEPAPNPHGRRLTEEEIMRHLEGAQGLIAGLEPLNRRVMTSAPGLRAIARVGIGMENVDQDAARDLGIKVSNTPDAPVRAVAELTLGVMIALSRKLFELSAELHAGRWSKTITQGLFGAKVLLVGYGRIGRAVGRLIAPLGAELLISDPALNAGDLSDGERLVSLEEGLAEADIVSIHAAGAEPIIGANEFQKMRPGALLLNSARGPLVDEDALIEALESGRLGGGWFDAFCKEPYEGRLTRFDRVLLTPHAATYTRSARRDMEFQAVENLLRDLGVAS